jgi:hypothetical protein
MRCRSMKQTVSHRLPLLLPERDALIPLRHLLAPIPPLVGAFSLELCYLLQELPVPRPGSAKRIPGKQPGRD